MELNPSLTDASDALIPRKSVVENADFDITAMVDLVFMMNIFFLVTWVGAALAEIDLPTARHCIPADPEACVTVTVLADANTQTPLVYLGDARSSARPVDSAEMDELIRAAVEKGKTQIPPKGEGIVSHDDPFRLSPMRQAISGAGKLGWPHRSLLRLRGEADSTAAPAATRS
ncbi:MAG: biopolymer transporter ExbD [Planctomycetota bacterium]|nr:biopolymer transporter ExbD [Planctomycetota bacterium]